MSSVTRSAFSEKKHENLKSKLESYAKEHNIKYSGSASLYDSVKREIREKTRHEVQLKKIFTDLGYTMEIDRGGLYVKYGVDPSTKPPSAQAEVHVDPTKYPSQEQRPAIALPPPDYEGDKESYDIDNNPEKKNTIEFYKNLVETRQSKGLACVKRVLPEFSLLLACLPLFFAFVACLRRLCPAPRGNPG